MPELIFRTAVFNDLDKIVSIYNASIPGRLATADTKPISTASRKDWFNQHDINPLDGIWVGEIDGVIVGWVSLSDFYGRPAYGHTKEVSIYLTPNYQHQHLGQQFIDFLEAQAKQLGISTLLAFIFKHNLPSKKLFKRNHFEIWGDLPAIAEMDGNLYSLLIMGKKLRK